MSDVSLKFVQSHVVVAILLSAFAAPVAALAQTSPTAPVTGDHYAARASDTGYAGVVNSTGGYSASVPLDLPGARGGLPVPVQVALGGRGFGAAGLGGDVPLSFIRHSPACLPNAPCNLAHRRPVSNGDAAPQMLDQYSVMLNGSSIDLVPISDGVWRARGSEQIEVHDLHTGVFELYDGNGLRYSFSSDPTGSGHPLDNGNLYLLQNIYGSGGTQVQLAYTIAGSAPPGLAIDLASVSYNYDATGTCAKNQVNLNYGAQAPAPLSIQMLTSSALERFHKLKERGEGTAIDVMAREAPADQPEPCAGAMRSLRAYQFDYQHDADTGQSQLQRVTMIGQEGTPERNVTLPVATYTYGQFKGSDGNITYVLGNEVNLPVGLTDGGIAETLSSPSTEDVANFLLTGGARGLIDLDGDGRPDIPVGQTFFHNVPSTGTFPATFPAGAVQGDSTPFIKGGGFIIGGEDPNTNIKTNRSSVTQQLIDMNGDGRIDIVNSDEENGFWIVYLNRPGSSADAIVWERRKISIAPMVQHLIEAGLLHDSLDRPITDPTTIPRLPLGRTFTTNFVHFRHCYKWTGSDWVNTSTANDPDHGRDQGEGWGSPNGAPPCVLPQFDNNIAPNFSSIEEEGQHSWVEWRLQDVNGDGYPDLVYNGSYVQEGIFNAAPPQGAPPPGIQFRQIDALWSAQFAGSSAVKALVNVAGVHLGSTGTNAFSAPVTLVDDPSCGIEKWSPGRSDLGEPLGRSKQVCGLEDVNGDGLVDRVLSIIESSNNGTEVPLTIATRGTGDLTTPFSTEMTLPGPATVVQTQIQPVTVAGHLGYLPPLLICPIDDQRGDPNSFPRQRIAGLHDLNGDGIPDYIFGTNDDPGVPADQTRWKVAFGTGVGFTDPVQVNGLFELSLEQVDCRARAGGSAATLTNRGLFDVDGDGIPDVVESSLTNSNVQSATHLDQNTGPAAGRLIAIDNGYGARTTIAYTSAKRDATTDHHVPFPEVVVASVTTTDTSNNPLVQPVLYAYGSASQFFDAAADRWVFRGYERRVTLQNTGDPAHPALGTATISESIPLFPFSLDGGSSTAFSRFQRYAQAGLPREDITVSGAVGTDPWALLARSPTDVAQPIAGKTYSWQERLLPPGSNAAAPNSPQYCLDMLDPYDFDGSNSYNAVNGGQDLCAQRGFVMQGVVSSYRGDALESPNAVSSGTRVAGFDDFGRVTDSISFPDLSDHSNDLCIHVDYAAPKDPTSPVRVLNAVAQQTVTARTAQGDCSGPTLAKKRFEYDNNRTSADNPVGQVSSGFITSSTVTRLDGDTHLPLGDDIKLFDATYDPVTGNLQTLTKTRNDGASTTSTIDSYDGFGLVATHATSTAFDPFDGGLLPMTTSVTPDPVTLSITSATNANGTVSGATYDGFGRLRFSKVTPPGGTEGVLSSITYNCFELNPPSDVDCSAGRNVAQKTLQDMVPCPPDPNDPNKCDENVASALGRSATTFLDSLGRVTRADVQLGADYQNRRVSVGSTTYDALGRVNFVRDPFDPSDVHADAYGTSYNYNTDGTPSCFIRGTGYQPATASADDANETYPTCFNRSFANSREILDRRDADSLLSGSNQFGVISRSIRDATGRVLERNALSSAGTILQDATFAYDALGHMSTMTRFGDPANKASPVTTQWHTDSLGWMTKLEEYVVGPQAPIVAPQTRSFDSWGNVTQVQWCDDKSDGVACPGKERSNFIRFDGRGRMTHREDRMAGQVVPETVGDFTYDANSGNIGFPRNNMLGRLASAIWPTGQQWFTYDAFGRVNSRSFIDTSVPSNDHHYEIHEFHDDGSEKTLHLALQDTNKQDEQVNYGYDSAGRVNSVIYNGLPTSSSSECGGGLTCISGLDTSTSSQTLFSAAGGNPIYDVFGRIINAQYGSSQFTASFSQVRRKLLSDVKVTSVDGSASREIHFPSANELTPHYDPVGRELTRVETRIFRAASTQFSTAWSYDQLGRLASNQQQFGSHNWGFSYDAVGNMLTQFDPGAVLGTPPINSFTYQDDRVCGIGYTFATPPQLPNCNVSYDGAGNIVSMPTLVSSVPGSSGTRTLKYFSNGAVRQINDGGSEADFTYDAFGALQQLAVNTPNADRRADKYFGAFIKQRIEGAQSVINRQIAAPGLVATLHGPMTGNWTFAFGEGRGTRFVTDQTGAFVQDVSYQPFGEAALKIGATPGTTNYTSDQWNGGDLLAAFGVVNLGARVYDPVLGRFLSRDPVIGKNPYAFASNDPVNRADPTGLDDKQTEPWPRAGDCGQDCKPVEPPSAPVVQPVLVGPANPHAAAEYYKIYNTSGTSGGTVGSEENLPYVWKHTPGDGYKHINGQGLVYVDPGTAFVNPFNRAGTRCNKSCHPGSDAGQDPRFPARNGEATASLVLALGFTIATLPYGGIGRLLVGDALLGDTAAEVAAEALADEEATWTGLSPAPEGLSKEELGRYYVKQALTKVQEAAAEERPALLRRLIETDVPDAMKNLHDAPFGSFTVNGQQDVYYGLNLNPAGAHPVVALDPVTGNVLTGSALPGEIPLTDLGGLKPFPR